MLNHGVPAEVRYRTVPAYLCSGAPEHRAPKLQLAWLSPLGLGFERYLDITNLWFYPQNLIRARVILTFQGGGHGMHLGMSKCLYLARILFWKWPVEALGDIENQKQIVPARFRGRFLRFWGFEGWELDGISVRSDWKQSRGLERPYLIKKIEKI